MCLETFARSLSSWWFSSLHESRLVRRRTTIFVQFKCVSHLVEWCTFVLQGALSPSGRQSASAYLDLSITWLMMMIMFNAQTWIKSLLLTCFFIFYPCKLFIVEYHIKSIKAAHLLKCNVPICCVFFPWFEEDWGYWLVGAMVDETLHYSGIQCISAEMCEKDKGVN